MKSYISFLAKHLLPLCLITIISIMPEKSIAQKPSDAQLEDALFQCLANKFIEIKEYAPLLGVPNRCETTLERDPTDHARAYDPKSGRNFHYDKKKQAWIDSKTGESVTSKNLEDALFCCLASKFVKIKEYAPALGTPNRCETTLQRDPSDHTRAFDPESGRNFAYDKTIPAWIDVKTGECICPKCPPTKTKKDSTGKTAYNDFPKNDFFVGFSLIREDNGNNGFYTYGGEFAYTRNLCRRGGITGDVGVNFGSYNMVDYTKINILAGGTYYPIKKAVPASDFNFSLHALAGVSNIKSRYSIGSYSSSASNSYFTMDIGGGFNYYFGDKTGVGLRFGYMPAFSKGNTSNNFRVALGLDFR